MTLGELETKRPATITINDAAEIMEVTPQFLRIALQQGKFPFGVGVEMSQWAYYINSDRFIYYMRCDKL
jgi:hypothetical protein